MKNTKLLLSTILVLGLSFALHAQSMFVLNNGEAEPGTEYGLSGVRKLTFGSGNMQVWQGTSSTPYTIANVRRVDFVGGTTPPPATCLNTNADFASDMEGWSSWTNPGTTADVTAATGELAVTNIVGATSRWHAQVVQNYNFENGVTYNITFKARSATEKAIGVLIRECVEGDCGTADNYQDFTIGTTMQEYSFTYEQGEPTYVYGQLIFELADNASDIYFDDICVSTGTLSTPTNTIEIKKDFLIYPNPAQSVLNMNLPSAGRVDVISLDGKLLISNNLQSGSNQINIDNLNAGMYICRYSNDIETKTLKLVKI